MSKIDIINRWYVDLYDQEEIQTDDVNFMLSVIGGDLKNILEVCCGSGRILVPLAKAGHKVTGLDMDDCMLERISPKANGLTNIKYSKADAINDDWSNNFDTVILAGNILINIVSSMNYKEAQKLFIKKAYNCLKLNGHLYIDFDCFIHPENFLDILAKELYLKVLIVLETMENQLCLIANMISKLKLQHLNVN